MHFVNRLRVAYIFFLIEIVFTEFVFYSDDPINEADLTRIGKALSLAIAYSANCGGIGSITGTNPNVIMKGQADMYVSPTAFIVIL